MSLLPPAHSFSHCLGKKHSRFLISIIAYICLGIASALVVLSYLPHWSHGDVLAHHAFCVDLLQGDFPISGWNVNKSFALFPDYIIYTACVALFGDSAVSLIAYASLFYIAIALTASYALKPVSSRFSASIGILAVALHASGAFFLDQKLLFTAFATPGHHGGVAITGFILIGWLLGGDPFRSRKSHLAFVTFLWLSILSDLLFVFSFAIPAMATMLTMSTYKNRVKPFAVSFLLGIILYIASRIALSSLGIFYFRGGLLGHVPSPENIRAEINQFVEDSPNLISHASWLIVIWLIALLTSALLLRRSTPYFKALSLLFITSSIITVSMPIATGFWRDWYSSRYFVAILFLPCLIPWIGIISTLKPILKDRILRLGIDVGALCLPLLFIISAWPQKLSLTDFQFREPADLYKLEEFAVARGLRYGLAEFWHAYPLKWLSEPALNVNHIREDRTPYFWTNNNYWWFEKQVDTGLYEWPSYNFIIANDLSPGYLRNTFGPPSEIVQVGSYEVWLFDQNGQERIRAVLEPEILRKLKGNWAVRQLGAFHLDTGASEGTPKSPLDPSSHPDTLMR